MFEYCENVRLWLYHEFKKRKTADNEVRSFILKKQLKILYLRNVAIYPSMSSISSSENTSFSINSELSPSSITVA